MIRAGASRVGGRAIGAAGRTVARRPQSARVQVVARVAGISLVVIAVEGDGGECGGLRCERPSRALALAEDSVSVRNVPVACEVFATGALALMSHPLFCGV